MNETCNKTIDVRNLKLTPSVWAGVGYDFASFQNKTEGLMTVLIKQRFHFQISPEHLNLNSKGSPLTHEFNSSSFIQQRRF